MVRRFVSYAHWNRPTVSLREHFKGIFLFSFSCENVGEDSESKEKKKAIDHGKNTMRGLSEFVGPRQTGLTQKSDEGPTNITRRMSGIYRRNNVVHRQKMSAVTRSRSREGASGRCLISVTPNRDPELFASKYAV